jgi:hypothetical protein
MGRDLLILVLTLVSMVLCGAVTLLLTAVVLMNLGTRFHGNYEHYGINYPALFWGPGILGFLAPAVLAWYLCRRD